MVKEAMAEVSETRRIQHGKRLAIPEFKVGDKLFFNIKNLGRGFSGKGEPKWKGPYVVLKAQSLLEYKFCADCQS